MQVFDVQTWRVFSCLTTMKLLMSFVVALRVWLNYFCVCVCVGVICEALREINVTGRGCLEGEFKLYEVREWDEVKRSLALLVHFLYWLCPLVQSCLRSIVFLFGLLGDKKVGWFCAVYLLLLIVFRLVNLPVPTWSAFHSFSRCLSLCGYLPWVCYVIVSSPRLVAG